MSEHVRVQELSEKLAVFCRMIYMEELVDHSGHVSARIPGTTRILVQPRGTSRAAITGRDFVVTDLEGNLIEGAEEPVSELPIHTCIYKVRSDVNAVAHLHPPITTAFTIAGTSLVPCCNQGALFGGPLDVYPDPTLVRNVAQGEDLARALGENVAVLMKGHGAVVTGPSVDACFVACIYLEDNARKQLYASALGKVIPYTADEIERVRDVGWEAKSVQKIWDHYSAKARASGMLVGA
ncbi:MAG: class II aldolase/adducin family protein [Chloroflexi bacterium]|nr:class II aldolase/adducin family protein [Chloroflexota bacterium]